MSTPNNPQATPKRPRSVRRAFVRVLSLGAVIYVVWCSTIYFMQRSMMYLPRFGSTITSDDHVPPGVQVLWRNIDGGERVEAWLSVPTTASDKDRVPLVVFTHGNAESIVDAWTTASVYNRLGCAVLLPEYRSYSRSGGKPSEAAIVDDAAWFLEETLASAPIDPDRLVFHGRSLGGGIAAQLAARHTPKALILQSSFTSVASFAPKYGVPTFLVKDSYRTDRVLESLDASVLILHGDSDTIVPTEHASRLRAILDAHPRPGRIVELSITPSGHNDHPRDARAYWKTIQDFLAKADVRPDRS
ncbi:MAG: alpha/beta hydrolase [Phycisphaerales bacterium]|nr:MAG: alpha/beta hydrolase [Phycisphaerales bacterium]